MADIQIINVNVGTKENPVVAPRVNIGTEQEPFFVPPHALKPDTPEGTEYWNLVANGDLELREDELGEILAFIEDHAKKG
jgi:hypothetical protein